MTGDVVIGQAATIRINTLLVGTVICERALCDATLTQLQKTVSWMFGDELWSWEMAHPPIRQAAIAEGYRQFPLMPTAEQARNLDDAERLALAAYGPTVKFARGPHRRNSADGFDTFGVIVGRGGSIRMPMLIRRGQRFA